jgi:hypothetical protein
MNSLGVVLTRVAAQLHLMHCWQQRLLLLLLLLLLLQGYQHCCAA